MKKTAKNGKKNMYSAEIIMYDDIVKNKGKNMTTLYFIEELKKEHARYQKMQKAKAAAAKATNVVQMRKQEIKVDVSNDYDNINRWTDESAYAKQYYGSVFNETTKFDKDWD